MTHQLVTRDTLRRQLMLNAARKPLPIGVGLAVVVAAIVLGASWLLPVALLFYVALAASTFFDGAEAERVGQRTYERARGSVPKGRAAAELGPELRELMRRARVEEQRILDAIAQSDLPFEEITVEVEALAGEMERIAARAQTVSSFLTSHEASELRMRLADLQRDAQSDPETARARERAAGRYPGSAARRRGARVRAPAVSRRDGAPDRLARRRARAARAHQRLLRPATARGRGA